MSRESNDERLRRGARECAVEGRHAWEGPRLRIALLDETDLWAGEAICDVTWAGTDRCARCGHTCEAKVRTFLQEKHEIRAGMLVGLGPGGSLVGWEPGSAPVGVALTIVRGGDSDGMVNVTLGDGA